MAEREGFEPPELSLNGFQDRRLKPLGHLSGLILQVKTDRTEKNHAVLVVIFSAPPMYGLSASGIVILPSAC